MLKNNTCEGTYGFSTPTRFLHCIFAFTSTDLRARPNRLYRSEWRLCEIKQRIFCKKKSSHSTSRYAFTSGALLFVRKAQEVARSEQLVVERSRLRCEAIGHSIDVSRQRFVLTCPNVTPYFNDTLRDKRQHAVTSTRQNTKDGLPVFDTDKVHVPQAAIRH